MVKVYLLHLVNSVRGAERGDTFYLGRGGRAYFWNFLVYLGENSGGINYQSDSMRLLSMTQLEKCLVQFIFHLVTIFVVLL